MDEKTAAARQTARTAIDYVVVAVNEGQDTFTGSYFTQDEVSYVLHIVVKEGAKAPALSLPASDALDVVWETAPRSRSELHELRAALAKQNDGSFVSIGTNIAAGRLVLTVKEGANLNSLTDAYGEYADVEAGERPAAAGCVDVNSCTPMRGAIQIESSLVACSYGFNSVGNTSPNIRMLTANHCNYNHIQNAYDYTFYHDGNLIGTEYAGEESMSGDFMKVPRSAGSAQRNWVYYTDAQQQYVINSVPGEASQNTGDPIHFSGYRHLGVDGEMLDVDICWWNDTPATRWSVAPRQARRCTGNPITLLSGDSGGPLFYSGAALGISSSVASGVVYYSFVTRAEDELNVSICITQACGI